MNRDTLVQADVAGLAAGVALAYLVRVLFGALDLSPNDAASFIGLSLVLGGPVVLAFYALTGLYAENWRERGPWPAVAAIGWAGMIGAFLLAYNKPLTAPASRTPTRSGVGELRRWLTLRGVEPVKERGVQVLTSRRGPARLALHALVVGRKRDLATT